jgi:hypothetical protein
MRCCARRRSKSPSGDKGSVVRLEKIDIAPDNEIRYTLFQTELPLSKRDALIVKFSGQYGIGSAGNGDARYMTAMVIAALSFVSPFGLVFDFTELRYEWGDMMSEVLSAGNGHWVDKDIEFSIVVSKLCKEAITSLLQMEMEIDDLSILHETLDGALADLDERLCQAN